MNIPSKITYREYLKRELESRCRRNPRYSLRSFARDLSMPPSKLSEALRGVRGISPEAGRRIAEKLELTERESDYFVTLVEAEHSRSSLARERAADLLRSFQAVHGYGELDLERFRILSDWHHFAILELCDVEGFRSDVAWIANRLGIGKEAAGEAIERLLDFGLLTRDGQGRLKQTQADLATPSGIPSREIRNHHSQILRKAELALEKYPVEQRDFSSTTLAIDQSQLPEARVFLREMRRRFAKDFQGAPKKNRVYCLSIQLFPLDQEKDEI